MAGCASILLACDLSDTPYHQNLRIALQLAPQASSVTVSAEADAISPNNSRNTTLLDTDLLSDLPTMDGRVMDLAAELVDPAASGGAVTISVDGIETSDLSVTASAISEIRVNRNPFAADYSRPAPHGSTSSPVREPATSTAT